MRLWAGRAPVGVRLAAVTALLVVAVGTVLLAASYWLLIVRLPDSFVVDVSRPVAAASGASGTTGCPVQAPCPDARTFVVEVGSAPDATAVASADISGDVTATSTGTVPAAAARQLVASAVEDTATQFESRLRSGFVTQAGILLIALTVPAVAVGGFAARRALRPVQAMSAAAGRLGAGSLGGRLPADGPRDELRELAETFNAMLDRVESAFDRERRLMANVSHELRTPLANQHVALEVGLEDPAATAEDLRRVAVTALEQNVRARRLIEAILLLSRAEQGGAGDGGGEVTDLAVAARHAVDAVAALPDAVPDLDVRLDTAPAPVAGQAVLVERLVGNLVENAVRHNVSGGFVRVVTSVIQGDGRVVVENSGPEVLPDAVDGLFEPFRRGPDGRGDRVRSDHGVGLGLSVVAAVARRYGARVEAVPRTGGGLRITVTIPGGRRQEPDGVTRTAQRDLPVRA